MKSKTRDEIITEIKRVEVAIEKTTSPSLNRDYRKRLAKLNKELRRVNNDTISKQKI